MRKSLRRLAGTLLILGSMSAAGSAYGQDANQREANVHFQRAVQLYSALVYGGPGLIGLICAQPTTPPA